MADQDSKKRNLKISVENFGPIREGSVELKPLTIFIGPNNTGKSYMALLVYALVRSLAQRRQPLLTQEQVRVIFDEPQFAPIKLLLLEKFRLGEDIQPKSLSAELQHSLQQLVYRAMSLLTTNIRGGISDYFGSDEVGDIARINARPRSAILRVSANSTDDPFLTLSSGAEKDSSLCHWKFPDVENLFIPVAQFRGNIISMPLVRELPIDTQTQIIAGALLMSLSLYYLFTNGIPSQATDYLPAGRTSLIQAWPGFTSMGLGSPFSSPRDRSPLAPFPATTRDFLQTLLEQVLGPKQPKPHAALLPALKMLEQRILAGEITVENNEAGFPLIVYRSGKLRLPLSRTSSMVGELAPLALWIKQVLQPGDTLIIDEPEAHLHLEAQRQVASVIARLVHAGVRVLITTHSSYIVHQISNHLLAGEATAERRAKLGFTDDDVLDYDDVGVYRFTPRRDGVHIKPVKVEPKWGIHEDEFAKVAERISDETYNLTVPYLIDEEPA